MSVEALSTGEVKSRSALEAFDCPHRYNQIHEQGVPDSGPEALRGQGFHEAAGRYIHLLSDAQQADNLDFAQQALSEALRRVPLTVALMEEVEMLFWRWAEGFKLDLEAYLTAEERQTDNESGVTWMPDLVEVRDGVLDIHDWKTYYVALTEEQAKDEFQTKFYLWQARRIWPGFGLYRMTYHFVRLGITVQAPLSDEDLDAFERHLVSLVAAIRRARETGYWPAVPGKHCRFCRLKCPIAAQPALQSIRAEDINEAATLAARLLVLERELKPLRDVLRGWCSEHGPVPVGKMQLEMTDRTTRKFSIGDVLEILSNHGIDVPTFELPQSSLTTFLKTKKNAKIAADLMPRAKEKHSATMRWGKLADDLPGLWDDDNETDFA